MNVYFEVFSKVDLFRLVRMCAEKCYYAQKQRQVKN